MRFQYISDIHLELWPAADPKHPKRDDFYRNILKPEAHTLILAGDIVSKTCGDRLEPFLTYCSDNWRHVIYVAGNHEYYTIAMNMEQVDQWLHELCSKFLNVHYLNCEELHFDERHVILGCTLWSEIDPTVPSSLLKQMNDFRRILVDGRTLTPDVYNELHYSQSKWLIETVQKRLEEGKKVYVVTHHLPTYLLIDKRFDGDPINCCYASEVARKMKLGPHAWFYGHTHSESVQHYNGTVYYINALGYPGEKKTAPVQHVTDHC